MNSATLSQVYEKYKGQTDKGTTHSYIDIYANMWDRLAGSIKSVLEIGVQSGSSLMLWRDYFPRAVIHGVDMDECFSVAKQERIVFYHMNIMNVVDVEAAFSDAPPFDIIIDDASHKLMEQLHTVGLLWQFLAKGGWYCVEDVQSEDGLVYFAPMGAGCSVFDLTSKSNRYDDRLVVIRKAW